MITLTVKKAEGINKVKGLIGDRKPSPILLETRFGIHTFGVRFPIDILILDNANHVKYIKESLRPNAIFFWNPRYKTVIELPENTIREKKIRINTEIKLTVSL